jgi:hypothetical protein
MKLDYEMQGFADAAWQIIEHNEPDISTERLMQMVADRLSQTYRKDFDVGHVAELMDPNFTPNKTTLSARK